MKGVLRRAAGINGWSGGLRFPSPENTGSSHDFGLGAFGSGSFGLTAVPSAATSGTGWVWVSASNLVKITTANAVVSGLDIAGGVLIQANGVTLSNSFVGGNIAVGGSSAGTLLSNLRVVNSGVTSAAVTLQANTSGTTIDHCTISGVDPLRGRASYGVQDSSNSATTLVQFCDIYWCRIFGSAINGSWINNYMHDSGFLTGDHTDGIDVEGTGTGSLLIQGNTILVPLTQTGAIHMNSSLSACSNVTIINNLLAGGGYALYAGNAGSHASAIQNVVITGNWFSTQYYANSGVFGAATDYNATAAGDVWSNNRWLDGINAGTTIAHP